jgi:hypothetical protein
MKVWGNAADGMLFFGAGVLGGVMLVAMLPGMPWIASVPNPTDLDLGAQRSMAAAAWWMVAVTGLSIVVGGASLYLIARTLQEARRSAAAAEAAVKQAEATLAETRRLGMAQSRAYLALAKMQFRADDNEFSIEWTTHNAGQSPARTVSIQIEFDYYVRRKGTWEIESNESVVRFMPDLPAALSSQDDEYIYLILPMDPQPSDGERVEIHGMLKYQDVFGVWHRDSFAFRRTFEDGDDWKELAPMQRRPEPASSDD